MDEFRSGVERLAEAAIGKDAAAKTVTRFDHDEAQAVARQLARRAITSRAGADDDEIGVEALRARRPERGHDDAARSQAPSRDPCHPPGFRIANQISALCN